MREIKFRAWDENLNKMYCEEEIEAREDLITSLSYGELVVFRKDDDWFSLLPLQYTGLKDVDGQEIFEGDIIQYDMERYEVYWSTDWAMFAVKGPQVQALMRYAQYGVVVGNIYESAAILPQDIEATE